MMLTSVLMTFAGKVISALGVGFVSYVGLDYMQGKFAGWISTQLGNIPADALQIFYISGGGVALNWFFGAFTFIASLKATAQLTATMRK
ncbi:DUF2523 domain-containing protein [Paralysiella testudinis]|uniref:DUF2523 domain-containing protein n=2 Tax=Paralysiella testudinis TaxID=2809020 RepID=A0A892ZP50_9NEIS|nr:DUF2523 domain-containing protein [Paralysiella testudinis]